MKRIMPALVLLLLIIALPVRNATAEPLMRNAVIGCAFGAGTLAAATYARLVPALATGVLAVPVSELIATNALIGCGIGMVGVVSATFVDQLYDSLFGSRL